MCSKGLRPGEGLAAAHGAEAEVKLIRGYPVTVNDEGITGFASRVAAELLGEHRVRLMPTPMMGSEDFSSRRAASRGP